MGQLGLVFGHTLIGQLAGGWTVFGRASIGQLAVGRFLNAPNPASWPGQWMRRGARQGGKILDTPSSDQVGHVKWAEF